MPQTPVKVRFYVDGHNLYYGSARPNGIKWLDLEKLLLTLVRQTIPNAEAEKILLFTAMVKGDDKQQRQENYFAALQQHSPRIEIVLGEFKRVPKTITYKGEKITGKAWEEKQTDVNLGGHVVQDAHTVAGTEFDIGCLVSGDSDMSYPLKVKSRLKQRMLLIVPRDEDDKTRPAPYDIVRHIYRKEDRILAIPRKIVQSSPLPPKIGKHQIPNQWQK